MSLTKFVGLLAGSTLTLTGVSYGAVEANNDTAAQIAELKAQIAALQTEKGEQWLTEQRAEQIRGVVQDVLADSSTRSSFQQGGATAGYNNGFFIASADGNYTMKINALEQFRFTWGNGYGATLSPGTGNSSADNYWGFENRRTQAYFSGNVVDPTWKYLVGIAYDSQLDPYYNPAGGANNFSLYYAQVTKTLGDGFSVTAGQQNVAFTLQSQLFNAGMTQMGEYSLFEYAFGAGQQVGLSGKWESDMIRAQVGYYNIIQSNGVAGASASQGWNNANNQSVALAGRAEFKMAGTWDQFSKESSFKGEEFGLVGGIGAFWQNARSTNAVPPYGFHPVGVTVDANAKFGGFNAIAQLIWQDSYAYGAGSSSVSSWGFNVQGGAFLTENLEVFGAWNYNNLSLQAANYLQVGGNLYFAKNNMKMSVIGTIPVSTTATTQSGAAAGTAQDAGGSYGMVPTGGADSVGNNFGLVVQLQMMF